MNLQKRKGICIDILYSEFAIELYRQKLIRNIKLDYEKVFIEDSCKNRYGRVNINHVADYEIRLSGERMNTENCKTRDPNSQRQIEKVALDSKIAFVIPQRKLVVFQIDTQDRIPSTFYITTNIKKDPNEVKPSEMTGTFTYLNDARKTWFRGRIYFYKADYSKAQTILKKLP